MLKINNHIALQLCAAILIFRSILNFAEDKTVNSFILYSILLASEPVMYPW